MINKVHFAEFVKQPLTAAGMPFPVITQGFP